MRIEDILNNPLVTSSIWNQSLRRSLFGSGNIFRTEIRDGKAVIISNVTGEASSSIEEALTKAGREAVTEMVRVTSAPTRSGDRYGVVAGILTEFKKDMLADPDRLRQNFNELGIDLGGQDFSDININILFHKTREKGGVKNIAQKLLKKIQDSNLFGIPVVDDEGVRLIQFVLNPNEQGEGVKLTETQSYRLLSMYKRDLLSVDKLEGIFRSSSSAQEQGSDLMKLLGKLGKRIRGDFAEREISLAGENLIEFLGARPNFKHATMQEGVLFLDRQYEMMLKYYMGRSNRSFKAALQDVYRGTDKDVSALAEFYRNQDADDLVGALISKYSPSISAQKELSLWMQNNIKTISRGSSFYSKDLEDAIKSSQLSDDAKELFNKVFAGIEYSDDGTALLNAKHMRAYMGRISSEINDLEKSLSSGTLDSSAASAARQRLASLKGLRAQAGGGGSLFDQVTARGHILGMTIKSAFRSVDFDGQLEKYVAILSRSDLKSELGIAKDLESLQLSGFGKYKETIFTDAVATAFHRDIYASDEAIEAMKLNAGEIFDEFRATINTGVISEKVKESINLRATQEIEDLPDYMRGSALRNREFARELQRMLQSGVNPRNSPRMIQLLYNYYASQIYRITDKGVEVAMPDVHRFAISSEANLLPTERSILGRGVDNVKFGDKSVELAKFRIKGHTMMLSANAIDDFRAALGGFDLDDKGMPRLVTMGPDGNERLGFFITRQPSGPQEYIVGRASFDIETLRALFGEDTRFGRNFIKELTDYSSYLQTEMENQRSRLGAAPADLLEKSGRVNRILSAITGSVDGMQEFREQDLDLYEQDIIQVLNRMESNRKLKLTRIKEDQFARLVDDFSGKGVAGAPLRITGQLPEYLGMPPTTRFGMHQLEESIGKVLTEKTQETFMNEIKKVYSSYGNLDVGIVDAIKTGNFEEFMQRAGASFDQNVSSLVNQVSGRIGLQRSVSGDDILGVYVNRTMAVGSTRDQLEALSRAIGDQDFVKGMARYQIGLLTQETAIDLATTLKVGGVKADMQQVNAAIVASLQGRGIAETELKTFVESLKDQSGNKIFTEGATLKEIGEDAMRNLGKQIGFGQAAFFAKSVRDENLKAGIDRSILERIVRNDGSMLLEGYLQGMEDYNFNSQEALNTMDNIRNVMATQDKDKIQELIYKLMSLSESNIYRSVSKTNDLGSYLTIIGDAMKKASKMSVATDPSLAGLRISQEAEDIAKNIIEKYKTQMSEAFGSEFDNLDDLVGYEYAKMTEDRFRLSARIMFDINEAARNSQQDIADIADAIEYVDSVSTERLSFFDRLSRLTPIIDDEIEDPQISKILSGMSKVYETMIQRRNIRIAQYNASMASEATRSLHQDLVASMGQDQQLTMKNLNEALDAMRGQAGEQGVIDAIADILAGRGGTVRETLAAVNAEEIFDTLVTEANALRGLVETAELGGIPLPKSLDIDATISPEELNALFGPNSDRDVKKVSYKRFRDAIKSDSFKEAFNTPFIKRSLYAVGALIAGSLMYTSAKDRSPEDMAGPPLLPGGSAYEQNYPMRVPEIGTYNMGMPVNAQMGASYKIQLMGSSREVEAAREAIANMNIAPVNATIYNALPRGNNDPLANFASSY